MKEIQLTQGKVAIVDDDMYEYLNQWKWCAHRSYTRDTWYAQRNSPRPHKKTINMHRVIMGVTDPEIEVDHRNGNGLFNVRENLRVCTTYQNGRNRGKQKNNTTGYKGVTWSDVAKERPYKAQLMINHKCVFLGYFSDPIEAAKAYDKKARELHGEFARLNFP